MLCSPSSHVAQQAGHNTHHLRYEDGRPELNCVAPSHIPNSMAVSLYKDPRKKPIPTMEQSRPVTA